MHSEKDHSAGFARPSGGANSDASVPSKDRFDLSLDLGSDIGSGRWFRGLGTMVGLSAVALAFWPAFAPLEAAPALDIDEAAREEYRSQMIMPLGLGADSGRRMAATQAVRTLAAAPERPQVQLLARLGQNGNFGSMLVRAGMSRSDADRVIALVEDAIPLSQLEAGTEVDITLGRRPAEKAPRPLNSLTFRAAFDLSLTIDRVSDGGQLALSKDFIRVDETPLRIRGQVGESLYRSARAAGAPASAIQAYLKELSKQVNVASGIKSTDTFDMILAHRRAATGERQAGQLLYAGIDRGEKPRVQLMRWVEEGGDNKARFFEASGVGEERGGFVRPVPGATSSGYGMRRHPILGYRRMHSGLDFRARHGTPILAVTDGTVSGAGRMGGCGKAVRLKHGGSLDTRYCHMSRIAVRKGQAVRRGQVIGYVGSTGLSTGPHLHYEVYRGGKSINPANVKFVTRAQLSGAELKRFREQLAVIKSVTPGSALADLEVLPDERGEDAPKREIDKLDAPVPVAGNAPKQTAGADS